jgi:predicted nuclease of predicted toxin-antitoxin system
MRLLLDANLSPGRIGVALGRRGLDVLSLALDPELGAPHDPQVLELAADQGRILVTARPDAKEWHDPSIAV